MRTLRVALAQINTTVGDFDGNARLALQGIEKAVAARADLVAFPELTITGYPPEDLVLHRQFVAANKAVLEKIARAAAGVVVIIGFVDGLEANDRPARNAAALLADRRVVHIYHKIRLPNYGVFDEQRYFSPGVECPVFELAGSMVGMNICEDVWTDVGPSEVQCAAGAEVIVNINASPYEMGKLEVRRRLVRGIATRNSAYAVYVNQVGGQDELVFDGGSMVYSPDGQPLVIAKQFEEDFVVVDLDLSAVERARKSAGSRPRPDPETLGRVGRAVRLPFDLPASWNGRPPAPAPPLRELMAEDAEVYQALVAGTRDYFAKTGFRHALVALSGGIDSAFTATVAVDALGKQNVTGLSLPSRYSSEGSMSDAADLARRLGIEMWTVPIEPGHRAFEEMLGRIFEGTAPNLAEENVQSRIRGNVTMTIANKFNWLVLTTGNKSEMATGYATLYGDMAGGFAVIKDVPKTLVYRLSNYRNRAARTSGEVPPIPQASIDKAPSAELKPDQTDQDTLPPYPVLDRLLERYIEKRQPVAEILAAEAALPEPRADEATVRRVIGMVDRNEYKRRQAPPGIKITGLAFGRDRRLPIASRYRPS
jgi:NAD+ synthase (glutamine-hydrolysing)